MWSKLIDVYVWQGCVNNVQHNKFLLNALKVRLGCHRDVSKNAKMKSTLYDSPSVVGE